MEEFLSLRRLLNGEDHHGGNTTGPAFPLELEVQLAVGHLHVKLLLVIVDLLILVEGIVRRQVLDVPEPEVLLAEGCEVHGLAHHGPSLGQDDPFAVNLVLAPEAGWAVDVDEHAIPAVGQIDGQAAGLDAHEVLIKRVGLEDVERAPDPGVFQAVAAALTVEGGRRDRRESLHHGAGARAEIERVQTFEDHALAAESSRSRRRLSR